MTTPAFYNAVRPQFGGTLSQRQVDGLNVILEASTGLPVEFRAYLLATAQHETGRTMQPIRETFASTDDSAVARLENAFRKGQLKSVKTPYWRKDADGKSWFGRGYVQLTHRYNYERASELTGIDLVANPSAAMRPDVAAKILVEGSVAGMFTGKALGTYLDMSVPDYAGARRVINGTDKASTIAGYARSYEKALRSLPVATPAPAPTPKPVIIDLPAVDITDTPTPPSVLGALMALWSAIFRR